MLAYFCVYASTFSFAGIVAGELITNTLHGPELPWYAWAACFWLGSAVLSYFKVELSAKVLTIFLFSELTVIGVYCALVFINGDANGAGVSLEPLSPAHWFDGNFSLGVLLAIGMYGGFEVTVPFREEVRNPVRVIPRASIHSAGGELLATLAAVMVVTSTVAVILAAHNITARYVFNLSADKILPARMASVHKRHGSPHIASIMTSAAALVLNAAAVVFGLDPLVFYTAVLGMTSFIALVIIFVCNMSVGTYMRRNGGQLASPLGNRCLPDSGCSRPGQRPGDGCNKLPHVGWRFRSTSRWTHGLYRRCVRPGRSDGERPSP